MLDPRASAKFYDALPKQFKDNFLLTRALTHRSYLNENRSVLEDNERLEFLGDSILGYVVAEWLYNHFPEKNEGVLTKLRSALVHTQQLADFARKINLGYVLLLGHGEDQAGGRERNAILCDAFEALIAAIYLNTDLTTVKDFIYPFLEDQIHIILANHSEEDVKSQLQEWAQAQGFPSPVYLLTGEFGPDHEKVFSVKVLINDKEIAEGLGGSKQLAEKSAAAAAIRKIGIKEA
ncbi:MAG: ribonuclease III [Chloroflexi bacterium]|nr:ribonuclease III [Chloroflexota bacterium]